MIFFQNASHLKGIYVTKLVALVLLFCVYAVGSIINPAKFPSPDETANYQVTKQFAQGKGFALTSPLTGLGGIVVPRSFTAADGKILQGSFLGMQILYGSIARAFGVWVIPLLTPLLSVLAVVVFYLLLKMFMQQRLALLSAVLLAVHPAFWYYTSRSMFHNVAFFDLALIGVFALLRATVRTGDDPAKKHMVWYALAGLSLGMAVAVRTSEVMWLGLVIIVLIIIARKKLDFKLGFWVMVVGVVLPMAVVLYYNSQLFGQPLSFGYAPTAIDISSVAAVSSGVINKVSSVFFPFGFHLKVIAQNFWNYGLKLFGVPSLLALFGFVMALRSKKTNAGKLYLGIALFVGAWLVVYYGSWVIQDNPDPNAVDIGTSYVRYWIPMYALSMPFAAMFLMRIAEWFGRRRRQALVVFVALIAFSSLLVVVVERTEGLAAVRSGTIEYQQLADAAARNTPNNAVILAGHGDKIFFPERSVIVSADTPQQLRELRQLMMSVPVYVYVSASESPSAVTQMWQQRGFSLTDEITLMKYERLFRLNDTLNTVTTVK